MQFGRRDSTVIQFESFVLSSVHHRHRSGLLWSSHSGVDERNWNDCKKEDTVWPPERNQTSTSVFTYQASGASSPELL